MPGEKDEDTGFLSRVYRFVTSPTTEWGDFDPGRDGEAGEPTDRSELQIMIERKRRNDFVRKQEFDLLRRIRRDGVTAAQIRAYGNDGHHAKTVAHGHDEAATHRATLRGKIDDLEKTMMLPPRTTATVREMPAVGPGTAGLSAPPPTAPVPVHELHGRHRSDRHGAEVTAPRVDLLFDAPAAAAAGETPAQTPSVSRWHPLVGGETAGQTQRADPVLEEAAFAFASADAVGCETLLRQLIAPGAGRARHTSTWLTLLDLYRATGQQQRFEATAADYHREFGLEPGPWESIPLRAAGVTAAAVGRTADPLRKEPQRWACPSFLDAQAIDALAQWCQGRPSGRLLDWSALQMIDSQAAHALEVLMTQWADASSEQHWKGIDRLLDLLEVAAPPGDAAAEPTFWRLRLATWRLLGQRQDFEAAGRDMQTLYGESPAPWQPPRQTVREGEPARETGRSEFMVSTQPDHLGRVRSAQIDLSGQLTGDIAGALARCDNELREAEVITVDCARLVRVDFVAAGELINWVAERRERQKAVHFRELHRLVALFFCAMGLDDHATLEVRSA